MLDVELSAAGTGIEHQIGSQTARELCDIEVGHVGGHGDDDRTGIAEHVEGEPYPGSDIDNGHHEVGVELLLVLPLGEA